ncbi:MAG: cell division protein FtsZ [Alphaproteobacteria bacterium]|nr:cell division protein FtsZ [Alphaproteobacteria bacterium]
MTVNLTIPEKEAEMKPQIIVFGVGGAGGNAVNNMIRSNLEGVDFVVANTDAQALALSESEHRIQLGVSITEGLGAGARPDIGRAAAEEGMDQILDALDRTHMAFITAGMGGGTGTGAAPVIARAARERGVLTVGVVTKPFHFEGQHRMRIAEEGIEELQQFVDTLIIIPNQNLFRVANEKTTFADAFKMADDVLNSGVRGVTDLMVMPGLINLDFADIRTVMSEMGKAMMGTGEAEGENRAVQAAEAAISNPLLDEISMKGARGVLINITGGLDLTLFEVDESANRIRDEVDPAANIIFGSTFDESLQGVMRVSVVATGIDADVTVKPRTTTISLVADNVAREIPEPQPEAAPAAAETVAVAEQVDSDEEAFEMPQLPARSDAGNDDAVEEIAASEADIVAGVAEESTPADPPFIAPPPIETAPVVQSEDRPDEFAAAALANASRPEPESAPARKSEGGRAASLFKRVTRAARDLAEAVDDDRAPDAARSEPKIATGAAARQTESEVKPIQTHITGLDQSDQRTALQNDEELLEIPAFLRRQAN